MTRSLMLAAAAAMALAAVSVMTPPTAADEYPVGDKSTMWADPYQIGSLRHLGEIYPSRPIPRRGTPSEFARGPRITKLEYELRGQTRPLEDYFDRARTTGFIVLKGGRIVFERYRLGADEHSLFTSWSMAKSIVSTLVGLAIGDGHIRGVDDAISDYLPELKGSAYDGVPIKAVLQMSSGVNFIEDYDASVSDSNIMWDESVDHNTTAITEFVRKSKRQREPFARFHYAGVETVALGWLVSRATGKTLSDYLSEKLWGPLGMEADANWVIDGRRVNANEVAFCCLNATLRDFARFGQLMLQNGAWRGKQLLPPGWVKEATRPDRPQVQPGKLYAGYDIGYQYQWWTFPGPDHAYTAQGVNGQFLYVNPAEHLVIVVTSAWPDWWSDDLERHTYAVFAAFAKALRE